MAMIVRESKYLHGRLEPRANPELEDREEAAPAHDDLDTAE